MKILSNDYRPNLPGVPGIAPGGPAIFARAFSKYVTEHGHEWIGLLDSYKKQDRVHIQAHKKNRGTSYYTCEFPSERIFPFLQQTQMQDPRMWFEEEVNALRAFMKQSCPDILFLNGYSVFAWMLMEAAHQEGIPILIQHAGIARMEYDIRKDMYPRAGRAMMLKMEKETAFLAQGHVFLNTYSRDVFFQKVARVPKSHAMIIPLPYAEVYAHPSKTKLSTPTGHGKNRDQVSIGCVARWDRIKNHTAFLRLAKEAKRQKLPWTFHAVTRIPETSINASMKAEYRENIEVVSPMEQRDLLAFYTSIDLLVLPSLFDVSPTVVMEAELQGKHTLISPEVGWSSEYTTTHMEDWIIGFSNPKKVVQRIQMLLKKRPTTRFQTYIRRTHAPDVVFAKYVRACSRLISSNK